jgi:hypothetical protein
MIGGLLFAGRNRHFSDQANPFPNSTGFWANSITTPSYSSISAKLSYTLRVRDPNKQMPPNEIDSIWLGDAGAKIYYGHIFCLGYKNAGHCQVTGFKLEESISAPA